MRMPGASRIMQYGFAISTGSATNNGVLHAVNKKKEDPGLFSVNTPPGEPVDQAQQDESEAHLARVTMKRSMSFC